MEYSIEHLYESNQNRCTRCGKVGVNLALTWASMRKHMEDQTAPTTHLDRMVVDENGNEHVCDILDIKNFVNFTLADDSEAP